jgi:small nuclear ribonucleoprotein (snRNP)-like protein
MSSIDEMLNEIRKYERSNIRVKVEEGSEYYGKLIGIRNSKHEGLGDIVIENSRKKKIIIRGYQIKTIEFES